MLLRFCCYQSGGYWIGRTRIEGAEKTWYASTLNSLKQKIGPFLGGAHRIGRLTYITGLLYIDGVPNDEENFAWLTTEREKRKYTKSAVKRVYKQQQKQDVPTKVDANDEPDDSKTFFYKEEDGCLKVYSKVLCKEYKMSLFN